jgi:hypothetical protein
MSSLRRSAVIAVVRARIASIAFAHAGVFGFGLRISSVSVARNTLVNAATWSFSAEIAVSRAWSALISCSVLSRSAASARARGSAASRSFTCSPARPITSAASRTSPRSVRTSSAAGSRSKTARAVPFSHATVRARVTRARSANTTTLSISPFAAARAATGASAVATRRHVIAARIISSGRAANPSGV